VGGLAMLLVNFRDRAPLFPGRRRNAVDRRDGVGEKMITPLRLQEPLRPSPASQIVTGGDPARSIFSAFPRRKTRGSGCRGTRKARWPPWSRKLPGGKRVEGADPEGIVPSALRTVKVRWRPSGRRPVPHSDPGPH